MGPAVITMQPVILKSTNDHKFGYTRSSKATDNDPLLDSTRIIGPGKTKTSNKSLEAIKKGGTIASNDTSVNPSAKEILHERRRRYALRVGSHFFFFFLSEAAGERRSAVVFAGSGVACRRDRGRARREF